jgi:D-alanyl-lipoteichoic acid acyltransferase DltB (MBOAT superfamily)
MGRWFREYDYRPLGGDRRGTGRMVFNTLVTWTGFGLWHGASWTFILWGLFNGVLLTVYRLLRAQSLLPGSGLAPTLLGHATMPVTLALLNIMFRSSDVATAKLVIARIVSWAPGWNVHPLWAVMLAALYLFHWANRKWSTEGFLLRFGWPLRLTWLAGMLAALMLFASSGRPFYYFQF